MNKSTMLALATALALADPPARAQQQPAAREPLSLAGALATAFRQSPLLEEAQAGSDAERARLQQARLRPNPEIGVAIDNLPTRGPLEGADAAATAWTLAMPLELSGQRRARAALASAGVDAAEAGRQLSAVDLARAVRAAYATALAADETVKVVSADVELARELEAGVGKLVEGGREPPLRAVTAKVERQTAEAALATAVADAAASQAALAALIGRQDTLFTLAAAPVPRGVAAPANPDLAIARAEQQRANARIAFERSLRAPVPRLNLGYRQFQQVPASAVTVGVSVTLPLFNRNGGNIAAAAAEARRAEASQRRVALEVVARQRAAEARITAAAAQIETLNGGLVPGAEEALRIARLGYAAGKFSFLDLLNAQRSLGSARRALIAARRDLAIAEAERDRALGIIPELEAKP